MVSPDAFLDGGFGYFASGVTPAADGSVTVRFYSDPNAAGVIAVNYGEADVDAANGPVVWRHKSPDTNFGTGASRQVGWANGIADGPVIPSRYVTGGATMYIRVLSVVLTDSANNFYIAAAESQTADAFAAGPQPYCRGASKLALPASRRGRG